MSEPTSTEPATGTPDARTTSPRRGSPWIVAGLLVLLGGWFVVVQVISRTGPPIDWIRNDLPRAEQLAKEKGRRLFLMLYEPGCKITEGNDRDLFSQRFARERLAQMVCCRVELKAEDALRRRFGFKRDPLLLVFEPGKDVPISRLEGKIDQLQFETYVDPGTGGKVQ
jgi:hypothetical protein